MEMETVLYKPRSGRPSTSEEDIERIGQSFSRSLRKSIRSTASVELQVPRSTIHKVLHKRLGLYAFKIQLMQDLKPDYKPKRKEFAVKISKSMATFLTVFALTMKQLFIWKAQQTMP